MTGDTVPERSLNGSSASIDASSITHAPACGERWRPALSRMVWWLGIPESSRIRGLPPCRVRDLTESLPVVPSHTAPPPERLAFVPRPLPPAGRVLALTRAG